MDIKKFDLSRLSGNRSFDPERIGYDDSLDIIRDELHSLRKSFVKIGWYLKHISEKGMYQEDGYRDVYELAHAKFRMSEATVNRMVNLCIEFSVNHDSPELDERYQDFSESQLFEMLPMKQEERDEVSPEMTVKEIREKKAGNRARKEPPGELVGDFIKMENIELSDHETVLELKEFMRKHFYNSSGGMHALPGNAVHSYAGSTRGIRLNDYDEITWLAFAKKAWAYKGQEPTQTPDAQDRDAGGTWLGEPDVASNGLKAERNQPASLMKDAARLSSDLYHGIRSSAQNNTLSQVEEFLCWSDALNETLHALREFKDQNNL